MPSITSSCIKSKFLSCELFLEVTNIFSVGNRKQGGMKHMLCTFNKLRESEVR